MFDQLQQLLSHRRPRLVCVAAGDGQAAAREHIAAIDHEVTAGLDADSLAESLRRFAAMSAADFEQIKTRSYRLLEDESWENVGKMYRKLFESILARRSAKR